MHGFYRKKKQKQNNNRKNLFLLLQSTGPAWESGYLYRGTVPAATHFSFKTSAEYLYTLSIFSSFKDYGIGCVLTEIRLLP